MFLHYLFAVTWWLSLKPFKTSTTACARCVVFYLWANEVHRPLRHDLFRETCVHICLENFQWIFDVYLHQLELSLDFMGRFVGSWSPTFRWVVLHTISLNSFHLRCILGGSAWIWMKSSNLFRFIEGPNHFSTSWHAKMSLTLDEPIENVLCSNSTSKHAPKTYRTWKVLYAKQPTPDKKSLWSEG